MHAGFGDHAVGIAMQDAVDPEHAAAMRNHALDGGVARIHHAAPRINAALLPRNANDWLSAWRKGALARSPGRARRIGASAGSTTPSHQCGGKRRSGLRASAIQHSAASIAPAAPSAW